MDSDNKKARWLLIILYLSFISLGLPDAVLGVAWPSMRLSFDKSLEVAGFLLSMTTILSVVSSLAAGFITARFSTGLVVAACAAMTSAAMFGYAFSPTWHALLFFTVFFGLGQGAVDTAVNAYMARSYSSRHMNWVHCCWGIGATGGPLIMTAVFGLGLSWRGGYAFIGCIQAALALVFFLSLKLWKPQASEQQSYGGEQATAGAAKTVSEEKSLPRAGFLASSLSGIAFYFFYPGIELVPGLWGASYLVEQLGASPASAAVSITMFWASLSLGRFLVGFPASRVSNACIIRCGILLAASGAALLLLGQSLFLCRAALILTGLGIAPLYPTMLHETPRRLGKEHADKIVGFQVGAALAGAATIPALVGIAARHASLAAFAYALVFFICLVAAAHEISLRNSLLRKGGEARQ